MNKFEALGLNALIVKAVSELGFETPTPIQEKTIPTLLLGNTDLVALAQTGTGKTAAFGLPLISLINFESSDTQALILCPTRELCMQITRDLQSFTKFINGSHIVAIYGGASIETQTRDIRKGAQIIVATPGRMVDMIDRKRVKLSTVRYAVLDEADEMLNMGFKEDLDTILSQTPKEKNTWLFSATMPDEVLRISKNYMDSPVEITAGTKNAGNENIEHLYYVVHARDKYKALKRIADFNPDIFAIVFCRTRIETQEVADQLIKDGYNADALHGDLSQAQRDMVMKRYRSRALQMLVATDVAARGIDVNDVTHVINYNLPDEIENYTHRSGRTARAGKSGVSIAIINMKEVGKIRMIERIIKQKFTQAKIPNGFDVCESQLFHLVKKVHNVEVNESGIGKYLPKIYEELNDLSKEEIIKRFVSIEFNQFLDYYKNAPDLNADSTRAERSSDGGGKQSAGKLFINLGEMDGLNKDTIKQYVSETSGIALDSVVWADVKSSFSFVEVKPEDVETVVANFKGQRYGNRKVSVEARSGSRENEGRRSFGSSSGNRSYGGGERRGGFGNKSSGGNFGGERRSYNKEKSFGERKEFGKPFSSPSEGGNSSERKDSFRKSKRPRKQF
jgi:ATP-dependent RNA helicase DeaD